MSHSGTGTAKATLADLERLSAESPRPEIFCLKLAQILHVRRDEVALLRVEKNSLRFVFPSELRAAGLVPLTGPAVAARTASTRSPLLSNTFARVRHVTLFESVKIGGKDSDDPSSQQLPIQKIMSVPIIASGGRMAGVVQVSRKGLDSSLAGDDFTSENLKLLEEAARILAGLPFMQEGAEL